LPLQIPGAAAAATPRGVGSARAIAGAVGLSLLATPLPGRAQTMVVAPSQPTPQSLRPAPIARGDGLVT